MSGIAGVLAVGGQTEDWLRRNAGRMTTSLAHRGPDGGGLWIDVRAGIALGHRRLAIVDLSEAGTQPMASANGRWVITFNGAIYNCHELRTDLRQRGFAFHSATDTEVIAAAVECWGIEDALCRLDGMFAFALWDRCHRALYLARDRFGEKPLYYTQTNRAFGFASELGALEQLESFHRNINEAARAEFLSRGYVGGAHSIFAGCHKLPPAHWMRYGEQPKRYWRATVHDEFRGSFDDAEDELDRLLRQAVRSRCVADLPVGTFLSGGVDSTIVAALGGARRTFTIGFESKEHDECAAASEIAAVLHLPNERCIVTPGDAARVIPRLPEIYTEPFADSSQIPTVLLSQWTAATVKVALAGDGGDELFSGYPRYSQLATLAQVPAPIRQFGSMVLEKLPAGEKTELLGEILRQADLRAMYGALMGNGSPAGAEPLAWMSLHDLENYLPDDLLVKVDRAAMSAGLETRLPMLTPSLVSCALSLPPAYRTGKRILKAVLSRYVPSHYTQRPKRGFTVPLAAWLRGPLRDWAEDLIPGIVAEVLPGSRCGRIWSRLMFEAWLRRPFAPVAMSDRQSESALHPVESE